MIPMKIMFISGKAQECDRIEQLIAEVDPRTFVFTRVQHLQQAAEELIFDRYHLVFIYMRPGGQSELKLIREINALTPCLPVMVIVEEDQTEIGRKAKAFGARGFITQDRVNAKFIRFALDCMKNQNSSTHLSSPPEQYILQTPDDPPPGV